MLSKTLDSLDKKLIQLLKEDGRISVSELSVRLGVTAPTVRSRIKSLEKAGMLKVAGLIDPHQHQELMTAVIGMNILSYGKLDEILGKLSHLDHVNWVAVVTGRYDVMAEVVVKGGMADLYRLTTDVIPNVGNVVKTETFVIMKSRQKWLRLPKGLEDW
jgi:Lrp/AsnC family transcriptional regulator for asnA, asnC and gidA